MGKDHPEDQPDQRTTHSTGLTQPENGSADPTITDRGSDRESSGQIGPYRLVRELGHGGMGKVYLASRTDAEFHKEVALKLVNADRRKGDVVRRLRREQRILSSLVHPNIARFLDGGVTDDGAPYFVMEYVRGQQIDKYCDRNRLGISERLHLFRQVCSAVQHAHRNLIVHRDLKPKNVFVDSGGVPKLLDFGIAKLLNPEVWGEASQTSTGLGPLTPEYASPEQVRGEPITTATDVYALGVMLYLLVTGRLPYELKSRQALDVFRAVTDQEPQPPSHALDDEPADGQTYRLRGELTVRKLRSRLRGDLDNVLLTALRKEPERRYPSVEALSEDLRRHLEGLPVKARRPTFAYRADKFVRRHAVSVASIALTIILLAAFATTVTVQSTRIATARDIAQREAAKATAINEFLQETLSSADPKGPLGREASVSEALASALDVLEDSFNDEPEIKAAVEHTLGTTFTNLGRYDDAERLLRASLETRVRLLGEPHRDVAASLGALGRLLTWTGDYAEGEQVLREAIRIRRDSYGAEYRELGISLNDLGTLLMDKKELVAATDALRESLSLVRQDPHTEPLETAEVLNNLGVVLAMRGEAASAEPLLREALGIRQKEPGNLHHAVAESLNNLGFLLYRRNELDEAEQLFRRSLGLRRAALGDDHIEVANGLVNVGNTLRRKSSCDRAEGLFGEALEILARILDSSDWRVAFVKSSYGDCLIQLGRYAAAELMLLESVRVLTETRGSVDDSTLRATRRLVQLYEAWDRPEQAAAYRAMLNEAESEPTS